MIAPSSEFPSSVIPVNISLATPWELEGINQLPSYDADQFIVPKSWKIVVENRIQINRIASELERMKKKWWTQMIAAYLQNVLENIFKEVFQNGRVNQDLLNSTLETFESVVVDWNKSLLKKYYSTASAVVTAHPLGRQKNSMVIETCFPDTVREMILYEMVALGSFIGHNYQWPIITRYAMNDHKTAEMIPVLDITKCKPLGPILLCKRFVDKFQLASCSLYKEHRKNGCPHETADAEDKAYAHVVPTVSGYVVGTRVSEVLSTANGNMRPSKIPLKSSLFYTRVPLGTEVQVGNMVLKPRYATVDVAFVLQELPVQEHFGNVAEPIQLAHSMEGLFADFVLLVIVVIIVGGILCVLRCYCSGLNSIRRRII